MKTFRNYLSEAAGRTLYHGTLPKRAESILKNGYDLSLVQCMWPFDYALSSCLSLRDVRRYGPGMTYIAFKFTGNIGTCEDFEEAGLGNPLRGWQCSKLKPQAFARAAMKKGFDALVVPYPPSSRTNSGEPIVYVYNLTLVSDMRIAR